MLNRHDWFGPVPARPLGLFRISIGLLALWRGLLALDDVLTITRAGHLRVPFDWWPLAAGRPYSLIVISLWLASAIVFTFGWRTRVSGGVLTGAMALTLLSDQQLYANHFYLLTLLVLLATVAGAGAAFSLDARQVGEAPVPAWWGISLLRAQLTIVYVFAALTKFTDGFLSGEVLAAQLGSGWLEFPSSLVTPGWMGALAIVTIAVELALAFGLWSDRWRPIVIPLGLGLHASIVALIVPWDRLAIFGLMMLAGYLLFLDAVPNSRKVFFDASCGFCQGWVSAFHRLDWLRVFEFVPSHRRGELEASGIAVADADRAIQLVEPTQRLDGFDAVRRILELTPAGYLWAPLGRLPLIRSAGARLYGRVAARRSCPASYADARQSSQLP